MLEDFKEIPHFNIVSYKQALRDNFNYMGVVLSCYEGYSLQKFIDVVKPLTSFIEKNGHSLITAIYFKDLAPFFKNNEY